MAKKDQYGLSYSYSLVFPWDMFESPVVAGFFYCYDLYNITFYIELKTVTILFRSLILTFSLFLTA